MKTFQLLKPLPICRDEETHKYLNKETNQWLAYSTTEVCNDLSEEDKENIEKWRFQWQPRGEKCHECLAEHMLGNGEIDPDEYGAWVEPLLQHELFTHFEPLAVEHMMSIPDKSVGGQLDLLGYDTKTKQIRLIDLKTKGKYSYFLKKRPTNRPAHCSGMQTPWRLPRLHDQLADVLHGFGVGLGAAWRFRFGAPIR